MYVSLRFVMSVLIVLTLSFIWVSIPFRSFDIIWVIRLVTKLLFVCGSLAAVASAYVRLESEWFSLGFCWASWRLASGYGIFSSVSSFCTADSSL